MLGFAAAFAGGWNQSDKTFCFGLTLPTPEGRNTGATQPRSSYGCVPGFAEDAVEFQLCGSLLSDEYFPNNATGSDDGLLWWAATCLHGDERYWRAAPFLRCELRHHAMTQIERVSPLESDRAGTRRRQALGPSP